jgi:hypothetical protein
MKRTTSLLVFLTLLLAAPGARASYDPLGGGATRLVLDKRFAAFLGQAGVRVTTKSGATKRGRTLVFPVSGGNLDPTVGTGEIDQQGSLIIRSPRSHVLMRKLVVKTTHAPLVAKVGGSQLKVATSATIDSRRDGFATIFNARQLKLTAKVATRLNKKLRPRQPFKAGQVIGVLASEAQPLTTAIAPTGRATLAFDPVFVAKLDQHFVALNPIFPAEHVGSTFTLPIIANGALAPDLSLGTLRSGGEIEFLQLGAGQIFWHELWFDMVAHDALAEVDLEPAPTFPGKLGQIPVLASGPATVTSNPAARTIGLSGSSLTMTAQTAGAFNGAFAEGKEAFAPGEVMGTLSFDAQGQ